MQHSTLRTTLSDIQWNRAQSLETSYIAAQEAAREKARVLALSVEAVAARYAFAPAHDLFRFTAAGECIQAAMTLTEGTDTLTVIAKVDDDGEQVWFITDAARLHFAAAVYIQAVQARLESNKSQSNRRAN